MDDNIPEENDQVLNIIRELLEPSDELDSSSVLGKSYHIDDLDLLRTRLGIEERSSESQAERGRNRTYAEAESIAANASITDIGNALAMIDHLICRNWLGYCYLDDDLNKQIGPEDILLKLSAAAALPEPIRTVNGSYYFFRNGLTNPSGHHAKVESALIDDLGNISIVWSTNRICNKPRTKGVGGDGNLFINRIALISRFLWEPQVLEVQCQNYSPSTLPPNIHIPIAGPIPKRYMTLINGLITTIKTRLADYQLVNFDLSGFLNYIEQKKRAVDLGWHIIQNRGGEIDLSNNTLPIRVIFSDFEQSLKQRCLEISKTNPLEGVELYKIFRALKEESHTYIMNMQTPLGVRGGKVVVAGFFGEANVYNPPILRVQGNIGLSHLDNLATIVREARDDNTGPLYSLEGLIAD